jgi:metallo-beta-lactamase class B
LTTGRAIDRSRSAVPAALARSLFAVLAAWAAGPIAADEAPDATPMCKVCAEWNAPQAPFRIHGNTYYVGVAGLSVVLVASDAGHVLIDGALGRSAERVAESLETLGYRIEDVRLIVNSHVHYDHAGGIAELQRRSGATVAASPASASVLERGESGPDDPQYGIVPPIPVVKDVRVVRDGETLRVGDLALTAHFTPGHTPGGTTWTWSSCEGERCLSFVYADSLAAVSAPDFRYSKSAAYPDAVADFERSFAAVAALPCDVLITPHPEASALFERLEQRERDGDADAFVNRAACRAYADGARARFRARLDEEAAERPAAEPGAAGAGGGARPAEAGGKTGAGKLGER